MIKIRLARTGRKLSPCFNIVATDSRNARDAGKHLSTIALYDPKAKEPIKNLKLEVLKDWLTKGAEMSDTVRTSSEQQHQIVINHHLVTVSLHKFSHN